MRSTSLRYFYVVGSGAPEMYDSSPHNLFPLPLTGDCPALANGRNPKILGTDYSTPDGTCIRDYVHVSNLAAAHAAAAQALEVGRSLESVYNLGSGTGVSVRPIMGATVEVTGINFAPELRNRRPGDPARIVADGTLAARDLDWKMRHSLHDTVASAYTAHQ